MMVTLSPSSKEPNTVGSTVTFSPDIETAFSGRVRGWPLLSKAEIIGEPDRVKVSPSASVWPASRFVTKEGSSSVFTMSIAVVTGASFTGVTLTVMVAAALFAAPSLTV